MLLEYKKRVILITRIFSYTLMHHNICSIFFFFFNDTATTEIYTLSLHDALPIRTRYSTASVTILGASYSVNRVAVFGISLVALLALHLFLTRTYWGKAIRAVAQNSESCTLVGIDVERVYSLSVGLGTALAGLAGVLASTLFAFNPSFGASELLRSFVII